MWTAVILAGGRGTRFGVEQKTQVHLDGRSLLDHVISSIDRAVPIIVVGPQQPTPRDVYFVREEPPFGGPTAALAAAMPLVETSRIGVLAADMPFAGTLLGRLACTTEGNVCYRDADGERQPLCSMFVTAQVNSVLDGLKSIEGRSMNDIVMQLDVHEIAIFPEDSWMLRDIDTPEDLAKFLC